MLSKLEVLFSSTARTEILHLFLLRPKDRFYQREIERETGQPIRAVQREVEKLEEVGLLLREPEGNRVFYRLDPGFPLLAELMALFRRAAAAGSSAGAVTADPPPRPEAVSQPFDWLETRAATPLPDRLRKVQVGGEWDRAY